ncbi:hypothetical protein ACKKBF_B36190 [Auxenochlorella protothecoides x Auxenochlorella symbiontica]
MLKRSVQWASPLISDTFVMPGQTSGAPRTLVAAYQGQDRLGMPSIGLSARAASAFILPRPASETLKGVNLSPAPDVDVTSPPGVSPANSPTSVSSSDDFLACGLLAEELADLHELERTLSSSKTVSMSIQVDRHAFK